MTQPYGVDEREFAPHPIGPEASPFATARGVTGQLLFGDGVRAKGVGFVAPMRVYVAGGRAFLRR